MGLTPHSQEAERAVLGAILEDSSVIGNIADYLKDGQVFYSARNKKIWQHILEMYNNREHIDPVSISSNMPNELKKEMGGAYYLTELLDSCIGTSQVNHHAEIIYKKWLQRKIIENSQQIMNIAREPNTDLNHLIEQSHQYTSEIEALRPGRSFDLRGAIKSAVRDILDSESLISFGYPLLDQRAGGMTRGEITVVGGRPGHGKCLAKGTKIRMFNGLLKKVENIQPNDWLMGIDSKPREVSSVTKGKEMMYEIIPDKKGLQSWKCNESHILSLVCSTNVNQRFKKDGIYNISIKDYLGLPSRVKAKLKQYKIGVEYPQSYVSLDPYFLGLWLGDGNTANCGITTADEEIVQYLQKIHREIGGKIRIVDMVDNKSSSYFLTCAKHSIQSRLTHYNLLGHKHIPIEYKINDRQTRLQVLAGIIDSGGYINRPNNYEICMIKERIIDDTLELAWSLGFAGYKHVRESEDGYKTYYASLAGNLNEIPVKIKRKILPKRKQIKNPLRTGIQVNSIGIGDYYGFTLEGKDDLFLLEDYTVTHNTSFVLNLLQKFLSQGLKVVMMNREMPNTEIMKKLITCQSKKLSYKDIRRGEMTEEDVEEIDRTSNYIMSNYSDLLYMFDDIRDIPAAFAEIKKIKPDVVIDDYIQLINVADKRDRRFEIEYIMNEYKWLAKTSNPKFAAILVSQLNREIEKRIDPIPKLSDLAEGGTIEQTAECVLFCYYEYKVLYNESNIGKFGIQIVASKVRYGETGMMTMGFNGDKVKFYNNKMEAGFG